MTWRRWSVTARNAPREGPDVVPGGHGGQHPMLLRAGLVEGDTEAGCWHRAGSGHYRGSAVVR